jgi:hypothetical protein
MPAVLQDSLQLKSFTDYETAKTILAKLASKDPNQVLLDADGQTPQPAENREEGESRKKGTDEVASTSENPSEESEMHGGDGNSGECDSLAQTNSPEEREGESGSQGKQQAQLQDANTDGGSQGQGNGDSQGDVSHSARHSDRNAPQSSSGETGNSTSSGCESGEKSQAPISQKAEKSESPNSDSGEGAATSPERDTEKKPSAALNDSAPRDEQNQKNESSEKSHASVSAEAQDNFKGDRQAENSEEEEVEGRTQQAQSESQDNLPGEGKPDCTNDGANEGVQASDDIPAHQKKWGKSFTKQEREEGKLSLSNSTNNGGATASLKDVSRMSPKLLKLCRQRLAALVGDSNQQPSPRRDYTEFCVRLKTYRNPQPARKEEEGRPVILLLADISGSCASFSEESVKVAKAASKLGVQGADILVVSHYNGTPHEMEINGEVVDVDSIKSKIVKNTVDNGCKWSNSSGWYAALMERYQVTVCIALGDWDASLEYAYIAQHPQCEKLIWLDNAHCSSRGTVIDRTKFALNHYKANYEGVKIPLLRQKLIYKDGCKDAIAFINNIKV